MIAPQNSQRGFVALITAIALSLALLTAAVALNQSSFFIRSSLLEAEYKARSLALAEGCADTALLHIAQNADWAGNKTVTINGETCDIRPVKKNVPAAGQNMIETRAIFRDAVTNLRVVVNASNAAVISWAEVPAF